MCRESDEIKAKCQRNEILKVRSGNDVDIFRGCCERAHSYSE